MANSFKGISRYQFNYRIGISDLFHFSSTFPYSFHWGFGVLGSWGFFDHLLGKAHVVGTPGSGFGAAGEGYFRLSAFNSRANVEEAMGRIRAL